MCLEDIFISATGINSRCYPCSGHANQLTGLVRISASLVWYGALATRQKSTMTYKQAEIEREWGKRKMLSEDSELFQQH